MKVIASYNLKGGVGKTTAAVNLAYLSARQGRRTLLWDLDPQGAATYLFRVKPRVKGGSPKLVRGSRPMLEAIKATDFAHLDLLPADFTYRHMDIDLNDRPNPQRTLRRLLSPLASEFDVVILDTPPSLSLVSENVLRASDVVLVPLIPTVLSVRTFEQLAAFTHELKGRKPKLRGYFSMLDRRRKLHTQILTDLPKENPLVSSIAIPSASAVEQMTVRREPLIVFAGKSPAAQAFGELWDEVAGLLKLPAVGAAAD
ncbi:MAG TPA: AAA family ATPase [Microlunatus sp.]